MARHQSGGEHLRALPPNQGVGRASVPAVPTRRRLRRGAEHPPPDELRFHVAAIMRSARRPTVCTKQKTLKKQWEKGLENIEALEQEPTIVWPEAPRHAPAKGNFNTLKSSEHIEHDVTYKT